VFNIDKSRKGINPFQREWFAQVIAALRSEGCARTKPPGLNSSYAPDKFIGDLDHALMRLADPKDIVAVTLRMLGQYTGVDRCDYAEVEADQDYFVILGDYTKAATNTISGRYRMSDFGETEWKGLLENHAYVVNDIEAEPSGTHIPPYLRSEVRSLVCVPLTKAGHVVAGMAVTQRTPRQWSSQEINLIDTVANRCWESVERVTALRRWKASYEDYRSFIAISSEGIWRFELEQPIPVTLPVDDQIELFYRFAYLAECNNAMSRMYGYDSADQILGARLDDLMPKSNPKNIDYLRALHASGYNLNDVESSELDRYGNPKVILNNLIAIVENGMIVRAWGTQRDITAQKQAEDALRASEERFAKAFQASPDALVISRIADGVVLEVNDSFVSMSGYARDEIIGKSAVQLGLYADPSSRERALKILREQDVVRDFEFPMRRKSGEVRWILFSAEAMDLRGEHCWLTIGRDITERKHTEEERERLLLQEKEAREEAEMASRMKDEFLATVSHELRTPLTAILGWATMLNRRSLSQFQTRLALQVIERSARSQARLVDDILDTARIITGRLKLDAHPVEIEQVFQAAVDVIRPSAEAKRIALQVVIDDRSSIVFGDANRVQQVIWNLLSNAVKFTSEGGRVEARLSRTDGHIEITVTDTGMGIEPQFIPYVFDRFRQADSTSTREYGGLGLGLAIVRHVVEMHGGTVAASSPGKGQGATFKVRFPIASPDLLQPEVRPQPNQMDDKQNLGGVRVLVVDDDLDTLEMLKVILQNRGAEVITASSAGDALTALEHSLPDALVSDLAMPEHDGHELIAHIRQRGPERGGNIPAVALTAYARVEDRVRALTAGFQMYLPKPVDPNELVAVVANLTHRYSPVSQPSQLVAPGS
jgi:PAS domain S-box-containing protein